MQTWAFTGNTVLYTDGNGNQWQRTYDSLGRLTKVREPDGTHQSPSMETDYTNYDALNNLWTVTQCGGSCPGQNRIRNFTFDGLSRLLSATNPEDGTSTYFYDANGNLTSKTSPLVNATSGTQTITYCYDGLNRMTYKSYVSGFSCSSPTSGLAASYAYDSSGISGAQNDIGMLTDEKSYAGTTLAFDRSPFAYDAMGRLQKERQCVLGNCSTLEVQPAYTWDSNGNLLTYSTGISPTSTVNPLTFTYSYDVANRLQTITSNWVDSTHPATILSTQTGTNHCSNAPPTSYSAFGKLMNAELGSGLVLNRAFDGGLREYCETDLGYVVP
ncbi:MAG TPA: hypothetical protein VMU48_12110 [Terracidiphilus sp.]|nr:hypothetical protein [Terracidiphilus sp.]